jgi:hypothetical protein
LPAGLRVPADEVAQGAEVGGRPMGTPNKGTQLVAETLLGFDVEDVLDPAAAEELQSLLARIIKRLMKFLTRKGYLIEEEGMSYLADSRRPVFSCRRHDASSALRRREGQLPDRSCRP